MEKKNTLLLTVIAIATLLVAVVGATFAYFTASGANNTNNATFSATAEGGTSQFTALFNKSDVSFNIAMVDMKENVTDEGNKTDNVALNVSLTSANSNTKTTCKYDIVYTWTTLNTYSSSNDYYYNQSASLGENKEFTYAVSGNSTVSEAQFASVASNGTKAVTLVDDAEISASSTTATTQDYVITLKFYNLALNQDAQKDKTFGGTLSVENVSCEYAAAS